MGHLSMVKVFFPLLLNIIFTTLIRKTRSTYPQFQDCKPCNCGKGPNISYPFYLPHQQKSYCGYPNFEISCKGEEPIFNMSGGDYLIKEIFYKNHSLLVTNYGLVQNDCPVPLHNITLERTPFKFFPDQIDLFFFYNCSGSVPANYVTYTVPCASYDASHHSFWMLVYNGLLEFSNNFTCKSLVSTPVNVEGEVGSEISGEKGYLEFLKKGFLLEWTVNNCSQCEGSGGRCGFLKKELVCFCPDGPHPISCNGGGKKELNVTVKLIVGFCALAVGILLACLFIYRRRLFGLIKRRNLSPSNSKSNSSSMDFEKGGIWYGVPIFSYDELEEATNNFDTNKELGDGGFGTVYRGKLRDGRVVAVKRLYDNNFKRVEQFMNEVVILTRLRHQNLVTLYGCTSRHCRELLLVYEYVPNGTVADHLHGDRAEAGSLTWPIRMSIAVETASALSYLHASDIIHRDVKTTNILLDNAFHVKVADFGLSRLFPTDVTHISTSPQGTPGYVDPEYHQCYQLTDKSDVYSFGVVLIELISSKPAVDITRHRHEINLANLAINKIQNRTLLELVDPSLGFESDIEVRRMITMVAELAFRCLQPEKELRPSMDEAWEILRGIESEDYKVEKAEIVDILGDHVGLLKNIPPPFSPDSVTLKWVSQSTTPGVSG